MQQRELNMSHIVIMVMSRFFSSPKVAKRQNNFYFLLHEKKELEGHYDFLDCRIEKQKGKKVLVVTGHYNQTGVEYVYQVIYDGYLSPEVKILSPQLITNPPHTYENGSLCLYYPKEQPWSNQTCSLYSCIIPWVHEWIVFYEIFLITGEWEHPEVLHSYK